MNSAAYTPELAAILQTFGGMQTCVDAGGSAAGAAQRAETDRSYKAQLGRESTNLIQLIYRAVFGNATAVEALTLYWLETMPHPLPASSSSSSSSSAPASGEAGKGAEYEALAGLLRALATAPAAPCVRVHRVGSKQRYCVMFHPFGVAAEGLRAALAVPLEHADPRLVRAFQHLIANPWAFRHMDEDATFGYFTLSCYAYDCEAQEELDACRPVMLCAALKAVIGRIRRETGRSAALDPPRPGARRGPAFLTYARAATEERIRAQVEQRLMAPEHWRGGARAAERELLHDVLRFVCHDQTAVSLPHPRVQEIRKQMARAGVMMAPPAGRGGQMRGRDIRHGANGGVEYAALPTPRDIYAFSDQVMTEWLRVLHLGRARARSASP